MTIHKCLIIVSPFLLSCFICACEEPTSPREDADLTADSDVSPPRDTGSDADETDVDAFETDADETDADERVDADETDADERVDADELDADKIVDTDEPAEPCEHGLGSPECQACVEALSAPYLELVPNGNFNASRDPSFHTDSLLYDTPSSGFAADDIDYFSHWDCTSDTGISTVRRLNIAPLGAHDMRLWKDSTFLSADEWSGGVPMIYFTQGLNDALHDGTESLFNMRRAYFHAEQGVWFIEEVLNQYDTSHGVSSQDGRAGHYLMNEYMASGCWWGESLAGEYCGVGSCPCMWSGWGPTANSPGSESLIPGVEETSTGNGIESYALMSTGEMGIRAIASAGEGTCILMNPSLFDYGADGRPMGLIVEIFSLWGGVEAGCPDMPFLAAGEELPAGDYVFAYEGEELGWQLQYPDPGHITPPLGAPNWIPHSSPAQFMQGQWTDPIVVRDLDGSATIALDCHEITHTAVDGLEYAGGVGMGEVSGWPEVFIFVASQPPYGGTPEGLWQNEWGSTMIHDVYLASANPVIPEGELLPSGTFIAESVVEAYRDIWGRDPTFPEGLVWTSSPSVDLRTQLIDHDATAEGIRGLYTSLLTAEATPEDVDSWREFLRGGGTYPEMVEALSLQTCGG